MKDPLKPIDLSEHVQQEIEHIYNSVDRERDCRPYLFLLDQSACLVAAWGMRYTTHGRRFLHALNLCREIAGLPDEPELLHGLRKHLFRSCERDDGFAWDDNRRRCGTCSDPRIEGSE